MTQSTLLTAELSTRGIVQLNGVLEHGWIARANEFLDNQFSEVGDGMRTYVGADSLAEAGLLKSLFTDRLRSVVNGIYDEPVVLYHCHVYEIEAASNKPHIHRNNLDGWHRDVETVACYRREVPDYVSIFVYLNPVGPDGGPFELVPRPPTRRPGKGTPCVSVVGDAGTTFAWNRSYFHRAAPNRSPVRRRVLKLSLQPARLPHDRMTQPEFTRARDLSGDNPFVHGLLSLGVVPPENDLLGPNAIGVFPIARTLDFSALHVAGYHALRARALVGRGTRVLAAVGRRE